MAAVDDLPDDDWWGPRAPLLKAVDHMFPDCTLCADSAFMATGVVCICAGGMIDLDADKAVPMGYGVIYIGDADGKPEQLIGQVESFVMWDESSHDTWDKIQQYIQGDNDATNKLYSRPDETREREEVAGSPGRGDAGLDHGGSPDQGRDDGGADEGPSQDVRDPKAVPQSGSTGNHQIRGETVSKFHIGQRVHLPATDIDEEEFGTVEGEESHGTILIRLDEQYHKPGDDGLREASVDFVEPVLP